MGVGGAATVKALNHDVGLQTTFFQQFEGESHIQKVGQEISGLKISNSNDQNVFSARYLFSTVRLI